MIHMIVEFLFFFSMCLKWKKTLCPLCKSAPVFQFELKVSDISIKETHDMKRWRFNGSIFHHTSGEKNRELFLPAEPVSKFSEHTSKSLNTDSLDMWMSFHKRLVLPLQNPCLAQCVLNKLGPLRDDWFDCTATNAPAQNYNLLLVRFSVGI